MGELIECPTVQMLDEPDFDAVGDWILDVHAAIAGGQLVLDWPGRPAWPYAVQFIPLVKNQVYHVQIKVDFIADPLHGGVRIKFGVHPFSTVSFLYMAPGTYDHLILAEDDSGRFEVGGVGHDWANVVKVDYVKCWNYAEDVMCRFGFLDMGLTFGNMWLIDTNKAMFQLVNEVTGTNILFIAEI